MNYNPICLTHILMVVLQFFYATVFSFDGTGGVKTHVLNFF